MTGPDSRSHEIIQAGWDDARTVTGLINEYMPAA